MAALSATGCYWQGEEDVWGVHLVVESEKWPETATLRSEVREAIAIAAWRWGQEPSVMAGWRLILKDGEVWCGGPNVLTAGCTDPLNRTVTVTTRGSESIFHSALAHEVGHVADVETGFLGLGSGDPDHVSREWSDCGRWLPLWRWSNLRTGTCTSYIGYWLAESCTLEQLACSP